MADTYIQALLPYLSVSFLPLCFFTSVFIPLFLLGPCCICSFTGYLFLFFSCLCPLHLSAWYFTLMGPLQALSKVRPKGREQNWKRKGGKKIWRERKKERERAVVAAASSWKAPFSFLFISSRLPAYLASSSTPMFFFPAAPKSPFSLAHMYANKASHANETGRNRQQRGRRNGRGMAGRSNRGYLGG